MILVCKAHDATDCLQCNIAAPDPEATQLWVPGKPATFARTKRSLNNSSGRAHAYTPEPYKTWHKDAIVHLKAQRRGTPALNGPLRMVATVAINGMLIELTPSPIPRPKLRGDIDNYGKAAGDVIQKPTKHRAGAGIINDDNQITDHTVRFHHT